MLGAVQSDIAITSCWMAFLVSAIDTFPLRNAAAHAHVPVGMANTATLLTLLRSCARLRVGSIWLHRDAAE
jgi:hypothetical protein